LGTGAPSVLGISSTSIGDFVRSSGAENSGVVLRPVVAATESIFEFNGTW
jgi:hypothetical protein